ncbi:MAG: response regulator [bacterium]|nr:response regulator [bacterium]
MKNHAETIQHQLEREKRERKNAERRLQQAETEVQTLKKALIEATRHKNEFLSSISHELRTPLNAMIGYTSLTMNALKDQIAPEFLNNLDKAEQSARHLLQLINDILDFSKIESGKIELFFEDIDLDDLLEDALINAEALLGLKADSIELETDIEPDLPVVTSDYARLQQIFDNLLSNAVKFTEQGHIHIHAGSLEEQTAIRVEVEDSGVGIPADKLEGIFESFKQVDGSTKKKFAGTGLGLAISKSFCDMLQITIGVESEEDRGTRFWLHIPLQAPFNQAGDPASGTQQSNSSLWKLSDDVPVDLRCFDSIVIVDDDAMNLRLHWEIFQTAGYKVHLATSGIECLDMVKQKKPDVILMDLGMPGMDGFETTQQLKQMPESAKSVIIACSAFTHREIQEKAIQAGCEGYITKPVEPQRLVSQVKHIVYSVQSKSDRKPDA